MAKFTLRVSKKTRFIGHLCASACFVGLFIWGWDLPVSEAVAYIILLLAFLFGIIVLSAILGFILRLMRGNPIVFDSSHYEIYQNNGIKNHNAKNNNTKNIDIKNNASSNPIPENDDLQHKPTALTINDAKKSQDQVK